jgi:hypothetical protein
MPLQAVEPKATPTFDQKLDRVAFDSGLHAELDEGPVGRSDPPEDLLDDSVFVALGIDFETVA